MSNTNNIYSKAKAELEKEKTAQLIALTKAQCKLDVITSDVKVHPERYLTSTVTEVLKAYQNVLASTLKEIKNLNINYPMQKADYLVNQQGTLDQILTLIQKTSERENAFFDRLEAML